MDEWDLFVQEVYTQLDQCPKPKTFQTIPVTAVIANAQSHLQRRPRLNLSPFRRSLYVSKIPSSPSINQSAKCVNDSCLSTGERFIDCPHLGDTVCQDCGTVQSSFIVQELCPFYWNHLGAHSTGFDIDSHIQGLISSYQPRFHWNEAEKLRSLTGPRIPKFNRDVVFGELVAMGFSPSSTINCPKLVIQEACRRIDQRCGISLYGRKWGEHWMCLISRFTSYTIQPPSQHPEDRIFFAGLFDSFCKAWPYCLHLLPGSRKQTQRSQLPQFLWIFRQFLITFRPAEFDHWTIWLPVLSRAKEKELDLFWKRVCFINGWIYINVDPFIKKILRDQRSKKKKRTSSSLPGSPSPRPKRQRRV